MLLITLNLPCFLIWITVWFKTINQKKQNNLTAKSIAKGPVMNFCCSTFSTLMAFLTSARTSNFQPWRRNMGLVWFHCETSDTAQLLKFLKGVDHDMNITEELLDLQSLKGQRRGMDLIIYVWSAVEDMKLPWSKVMLPVLMVRLPQPVNEVDYPLWSVIKSEKMEADLLNFTA